MRRTFITFAVGDDYIRLSEVLKKSVESFSEYSLKIFGVEDFDIEYTPDIWEPGYIYIYKILSCIKALDEYDEVVWLDNDCLVTNNIDKIWEMKLERYPLLPKHRFQNFHIWPHSKIDYSHPSIMTEGKLRVGVSGEFENSYLQACCMFFNKESLDFFNEVLSYFENYDNMDFPYGDESIINLLMWKGRLSKNLGDIFLCSYYFSPYILDEFIKSKNSNQYQDLFDISKRLDNMEEGDWAAHNRLCLIENNFDRILFFHGTKSTELHQRYLNLMLEYRI